MKKLFLSILIILTMLSANNCKKDDNKGEFFINLGTVDFYNGYNQDQLIITDDNNLVVFYCIKESYLKYIFHLKKLDFSGNEIWDKKYEFDSIPHPGGIIQSTDEGFLLTGELEDIDDWVDTKAFILKTDQNGDSLWTKMYLDGYLDKGIKFLPAGSSDNLLLMYTDLSKNLLLKVNSEGDTIFTKYLERQRCDPSCSDYCDFRSDNIGNYFFAGDYLAKFDNNFNSLWFKELNCNGKSMVIDQENNCIVFGGNGNYSSSDYYLVKYDNAGNLIWEKTYDFYDKDKSQHIELTSDGGYVLIGSSEDVSYDVTLSEIMKVIKVDKDGNITGEGEFNYGTNELNQAISIKQVSSNQYVILGISDNELELFKATID